MNLRILIAMGLFALSWNGLQCQNFAPKVQQTDIGSVTFTAGAKNVSVDVNDATGQIIMAWQESNGANGIDVFMALYDAKFQVMAGGWPLRVNLTTAGDQVKPFVKVDQSNGNFAVLWIGPSGGTPQAFARVFDATGTALSSFASVDRVASSTGFEKLKIMGAWDASGNLYPTFNYKFNNTTDYIYFNKMSSSTGLLTGNEVWVNVVPSASKKHILGDVEYNSQVGLIFGWHSYNTNSSVSVVKTRIFTTGQLAVTGEVNVNGGTTGENSVSLDVHDDHKTIVYSWSKEQANNWLVKAKVMKLNATNNGLLDDVATFTVVNSPSNWLAQYPKVAFSEMSGHFVIVYDYQDNSVVTKPVTVKAAMLRYCYSSTGGSTASLLSEYSMISTAASSYQPVSAAVAFSKAQLQLAMGWEKKSGSNTCVKGSLWELSPEISFALMKKKDDPNLYRSLGNLFLLAYEQREIADDVTFEFYDDFTKTWNPIAAITKTSEVAPNRYVLWLPGLTVNKTYLIRTRNPKGEYEYLRMLKKDNPNCASCQGCN